MSRNHHRAASVAARRIRRWSATYLCEWLEERRLLTGNWTTLADPVPNNAAGNADGAQLMMLLPDGMVMVHGTVNTLASAGGPTVTSAVASSAWYKLTPNGNNYVNGTWSTLASMSVPRLFFGSNVLPSGKVFVVGGEYSLDNNNPPNSVQPFLSSGEIYDPSNNAWSNIKDFNTTGNANFGDDPTEMLPGGNVLAGLINGTATYIYDPQANTWTPTTGSKRDVDQSDEESWVTLPDDSILSYDVYGSTASVGHSQRYIPTTGLWQDAGNLPIVLSSAAVGYELGPAFLLPNGDAWFTGGNGNTAFYTPSTGSWRAGPALPNGDVAADAPGAMLPNGHILIAGSPVGTANPNGTGYTFPKTTRVYEFDPVANTYANVTPTVSGFSLNDRNSYVSCMLVLPTGQVLMCNDSGTVAVYTPDGGPQDAWKPYVANITSLGFNIFHVTGSQLTGISEGAAYGDDNEMSSNYPIVQVMDQFGTVAYARTFDWSIGVAKGSTPQSFNFSLPPGWNADAYLLTFIANGIPSPQVLNVQMGGATTSNLSLVAYESSNVYVYANGHTESIWPLSSFVSLIVSGDFGADQIGVSAVDGNFGGRFITVNGNAGNDVISVQTNGSSQTFVDGDDDNDFIELFNTLGQPSFVDGNAGQDTLTLDGNTYDDDSVTIQSPNITVSGLQITEHDFESLNLEMNTGDVDLYAPDAGTIASIRLETNTNVANTEADAVRVHSLGILSPLTVETFGGDDTLTVGDGDLYQIKSSVNFLGDAGTDSLILNGTTTEASFYAFTTTSVDYSSLVRSTPIYSIRYSTSVEAASVNAGPGNDAFYAVVSNAGFTSVAYGNGGNDGFSTGDYGSGVGLDELLGQIIFYGGPDLDSIYLDDRAAAASRTYTIGSNSIKSQVSAAVIFDATTESVTLAGTNDHNGTYNLAGTATLTNFTLNGGAVADQFFINNNAHVNVTLNGGAGSDGLTVDDRNSPGILQMTLTSTTITRVFFGSPAISTITLNAIDLPTYYAGANTSTINVFGTPVSAFGYYFTLYGGTTANTFNVRPHDPVTGATTFLSRLDITGQGGVDTMILDDSASPVPVHYTITGADQPNLWLYYDSPDVPTMLIEQDVENATLIGSAGADSYDLHSANIHQTISIVGGNGDDTVTAGGGDLRANIPILGSFFFDGGGDIDAFTLANSATTADWTYTRSQTFILASKTSYVVGFHENAENASIVSGSGHDTFLVADDGPDVQPGGAPPAAPMPDGSVPNDYVDTYDGGTGGDFFLIGNAGLTSGINAAIHIVDGVGDQDVVEIDNSADTDPIVAHINGNLVGDSVGDNLFGPGGSLSHEGVANLEPFTSSSANDTIFVHPSPTTVVSVHASDAAGSSDALNLALADAVNPVATVNPDGSVTYTSDNYQPLTVYGFDTTTIDDIAPFVLDAQLDFDVPVQDLTVDFSEDVSASFNTGNVIITNTTTGEELSQGVMQLDYNPESNRATVTFPGLPQGALPDGNYHVLIALSYTDASGNPATLPFEFDSFILSADANHDRSVDTLDFTALAQNFNQSSATFTQGDFNYDGMVNALDFNVIATNFGTYLAPPAPEVAVVNAEARPALATLASQPPLARQSLLFSDQRFSGDGIDRLLV